MDQSDLCRVLVTDVSGVRYAAELSAASLYEAAVRAVGMWAVGRNSGGLLPSTEVVEARIRPRAPHRGSGLMLVRDWLQSEASDPGEQARKQWLRELLNGKAA